ncbi:MAG: DUF4199 domain-containing protein [Saprospiraceae bacterium]
MTTLDNPTQGKDESTVPFLPTAIRYGLIGGLISVVYSLISNMLGFSIPTSIGSWLLSIGLMLIIFFGTSILAIRQHRNKELGGFITFKRAFLTGLVTLVIMAVISTLFGILYITVIDPGFAKDSVGKMEEFLASFGMPEDQMEEQLNKAMEGFTPMGMVINTAGLLVFDAVIMLIVAAVMKKKPVFE